MSAVRTRQDKYLEVLVHCVSEQAACKEANISRTTVERWRHNDVEGFNARYAVANEARLNRLEDRMFECLDWATTPENFEKLLRYPTLYMFALKAGKPQYRDSVQSAGGAAELLQALTKLQDNDAPPPPDTDNTVPDENRRHILTTRENHNKLEGSVSDQLKEIFGYKGD